MSLSQFDGARRHRQGAAVGGGHVYEDACLKQSWASWLDEMFQRCGLGIGLRFLLQLARLDVGLASGAMSPVVVLLLSSAQMALLEHFRQLLRDALVPQSFLTSCQPVLWALLLSPFSPFAFGRGLYFRPWCRML